MKSILGVVLAIGALAGRISAQGFPFPCVLDPCEDDPTFLAFGGLSCSTPGAAICSDPAAPDACPIACSTCSPCREPEPIPGFDAIVQSVAISDTQVAVQLLCSKEFAGGQFQTFCTLESGEEVSVEIFSAFGGITTSTTFTVPTGISGKWLTFSLESESIPPGFFLVTTLETESLSAKGCKEGSVNLQNGVVVGTPANPLPFCGTGDIPCPGVPPEPSPPPPGCAFVPGDVNGDALISVLDLIATINDIIGLAELSAGAICAADLDVNGIIDVSDIIINVAFILG